VNRLARNRQDEERDDTRGPHGKAHGNRHRGTARPAEEPASFTRKIPRPDRQIQASAHERPQLDTMTMD
jgi:hypothetical protein